MKSYSSVQASSIISVFITSEPMTAKDALLLYKSRDSSEKLFRGDKSLRVYGDAAADDNAVETLQKILDKRDAKLKYTKYNCENGK